MERTLFIVKPDAVASGNVGNIIAHVESDGFAIKELKMLTMSRRLAEKFYDVHRDKPFFDDLVVFMTSGPCVPMILEKERAIERLRELVGATDSREAAEGTIRAAFGTDKQKNAVHASDSGKSAAYEIETVFGNS
jgi:nucleoside-diphosphate kinase